MSEVNPRVQFFMQIPPDPLTTTAPFIKYMQFVPATPAISFPVDSPDTIPPQYFNLVNPGGGLNRITIQNATYNEMPLINSEIHILEEGLYRITFHINFYMTTGIQRFILSVQQKNRTTGPPNYTPMGTAADINPQIGITGVPTPNPQQDIAIPGFVCISEASGLICIDNLDPVEGNNNINLVLQSILPDFPVSESDMTAIPPVPILSANYIVIEKVSELDPPPSSQ